jgi:hypothetical protein
MVDKISPLSRYLPIFFYDLSGKLTISFPASLTNQVCNVLQKGDSLKITRLLSSDLPIIEGILN